MTEWMGGRQEWKKRGGKEERENDGEGERIENPDSSHTLPRSRKCYLVCGNTRERRGKQKNKYKEEMACGVAHSL